MIGLFVILLTALLLLFGAHALRQWLTTVREASRHVVLVRDGDGVIAVPVKGLYKNGAKNSMRPYLAIAPEGLRFKVLRQEAWPFAVLKEVCVRNALFGPRLSFVSQRQGVLEAQFYSPEIPRQVLAALPASVPLCAKATTLRDGRSAVKSNTA